MLKSLEILVSWKVATENAPQNFEGTKSPKIFENHSLIHPWNPGINLRWRSCHPNFTKVAYTLNVLKCTWIWISFVNFLLTGWNLRNSLFGCNVHQKQSCLERKKGLHDWIRRNGERIWQSRDQLHWLRGEYLLINSTHILAGFWLRLSHLTYFVKYFHDICSYSHNLPEMTLQNTMH